MRKNNLRVSMEVGNDGVALIRILNPPVNALAPPILAGLKEKYAEAMSREGGRFSGGFDISVLELVHQTGDISRLPDVSVQLVCSIIEDAKKPSVVAIEGLALGGGLELIMGCHARIATPKVQLGFPELTLGVLPGTQRLPRLVGTAKDIEMILTSKFIMSEEGNKLGLIDAIVSKEELLRVVRLWALDIAERRKPWISSLQQTNKLGSLAESHKVIQAAREQAKRTAPNMPQHQACLDAVEEGIFFGGYSGVLKTLQEAFFFAQSAIAKVPNVTDIGLKPRPVKKVAVIGGGLMGSGIATALLSLRKSTMMAKGKTTEDKVKKALLILTGVLDYAEFKHVDMVIEAVTESIPVKQSIFRELEKVCSCDCILASNTSTIDLNVVGQKTSSQERIIGAYFFSPAHVMSLLEIVRTDKTSSQVILDLMTVGKTVKKVCVVVGNCIGFAVNRTFFPYTQGAHILANLGVEVFRIDRLISSFGMPIGPFQLQDLAGYGVGMAVGEEFSSSFPDRTFKSPPRKNNGKGYYKYEKGCKPKPDLTVLPIIKESIKLTNLMPGGKPLSLSDQEIVEMIMFPVVNEACRVLDGGVVVRASDLDAASIHGMSFPSYRGGLVFWADTVGAKHIYSSLKKWLEMYGNFFRPSEFLEDRAIKGIPLSAPPSTPQAPKS
ncbi:hypothetical protein C5167_051092, partial [Papaver somniferum]